MAKIVNYKRCPLKKRPIVFEDDVELVESQQQQYQPEHHQSAFTSTKRRLSHDEVCDQPQDLSLKRKATHFAQDSDYQLPAKREYVLNLSAKATVEYRPDSPVSSSSSSSDLLAMARESSVMLSPQAEDNSMDYPIHMRGLTAATSSYTTNPYQSAFVMAAGCNPITALWNSYQQSSSTTSIFPSPASSVANSQHSPRSVYSGCYQQMTPPSSPGSDSGSEPEDLSVRNDIPLPALFHLFDEAPSGAHGANSGYAASYSSSASQSSHSSSTASNLSTKSYRFKCEQCNKMYSTSMGLSKHQQFHCPAAECNQEKKQHACQDCGKLYTSIGALKMHIRTHTLPCKCPICGKAFSRPWLLQGHIRTHTGEKPFQCPDCPRSFADRSNLRAHQQTHVDIKKYACKVCHKSFSRMSLLNKHANSNCTITIA